MSKVPVVAIFNSNDDVVEMLRFAIERAGMVVVSRNIDAIRRGQQRLADFVEEHDPSVILYDLVPPYDRSWRFLEHLRDTPSMRGRRFVITSTNAERANAIIGGAEHVLEIVGKPYDIDAVVSAVEAAARGGAPALPPGARRA
jgi:DNA-binding NarL/FixJ family response regulator